MFLTGGSLLGAMRHESFADVRDIDLGIKMKPLNIISLLQAYDTLKKEEYKLFLSYYNIKIRNDEIKDLKIFIEEFQ